MNGFYAGGNRAALESLVLENAGNPEVLFVFPTDVAVSHWVDRLLRLRGGGSLGMRQFIAWDTFKRDSIRSRNQNRKSIPGALRKIFAAVLIRENAVLAERGKGLFHCLIPGKFAASADSFASWIAEILPQLGRWFERASGLPVTEITGEHELFFSGLEGDERDLFTLARRYRRFLDAQGLFEPAWEKPPFDDPGKLCYIFFPECLSDWGEYRELLEASDHVIPVHPGGPPDGEPLGEEPPARVFFYPSARGEITQAALYIRALHDNQGLSWDSISVSFPDNGAGASGAFSAAESYEPYVLREFALRDIPFVHRRGKALTSYPAGQFFTALSRCVTENFSFQALSGLLLNRHLPWKNSGIINRLVEFGIKNNCVSSWEEGGKKIDVWEDAFQASGGGGDGVGGDSGGNIGDFYRSLKTHIEKLKGSESFAHIRGHYFAFREAFLEMDQCLPETGLVLSRCVSELLALIELEKSFPGVKAPDPWTFFVEYLGEVQYLAQQRDSGVTILPYRTAAPAPFHCHIVLGASQESLSLVFTRLGFLPRAKRNRLGLSDDDASQGFIDLHKFNSLVPAAFFCSADTFSGFAIPHSYLLEGGSLPPGPHSVAAHPPLRGAPPPATPPAGVCGPHPTQDFAQDLYLGERDICRLLEETSPPPDLSPALHSAQSRGFHAWLKRRMSGAPASGAGDQGPDPLLMELIRRRYFHLGQLSVSATAMKPYFHCALRWLFQYVLKLEAASTEAALTAENMLGTLYHAALDTFFREAKKINRGILLGLVDRGLPGEYRALLEHCGKIFEPGSLPGLGETSALSARFLRAEKRAVLEQTESILVMVLEYFSGSRIVGSELDYSAPGGKNWYYSGQIDCLLEDPEGRGVILDFKLSVMPSKKSCTGGGGRGLEDFQLPMYITLAEKKGNKPVHTALFISILQAKPQVLFGFIESPKKAIPGRSKARIERDAGEPNQFHAILGEFQEKARQYAGEVSRGNFTVFSPGGRRCAACDYHRICRTLYSVDQERDPALGPIQVQPAPPAGKEALHG